MRNNADKNRKWWEQRVANKTWKTYNSLEEKNRALLDFYMKASEEIRKELYTLAEQISADGILTRTEMYEQQRLQKLEKKYRDIAYNLGKQVEQTATGNMQSGFQETYKNVAVGMGDIDYTMPNKKLMEELLNNPWRGDTFSGRLWGNQKKLAVGLNDILRTGLQQGLTVTEMAIRLNNFMGQSFNVCHRLVRTETMHYLNSATMQRYKDAGVEYVQIIAAQDERTCKECGKYHLKVYPIDKCPVLPFHANCRCTIVPCFDKELITEYKKKNGGVSQNDKVVKNKVEKSKGSAIIESVNTKEVKDVHSIGKIDKEIYRCITADIVTDEVIITEERIRHIKERHPNDYERYYGFLRNIVENPDYIVETNKPNTALILKEIVESEEKQFKTVLRLTTSTDNPDFKNSIITFMKINEKEWNRLIRNKVILYKKE